jgi:hypothetical protein
MSKKTKQDQIDELEETCKRLLATIDEKNAELLSVYRDYYWRSSRESKEKRES